jgi:quercetin dioxygenase-like cupin family protein
MPERVTIRELPEQTHTDVFEEPRPRTVRLKLDADERVPGHSHPGMDIVLYLVSGHLELSLDDETYEVRPEQLVQFSGDCEISPRAVEPSVAILVFAPTGEPAT